LQYLKIDVALFSETQLKPHMRFYIQSYDIYRTDRHDGEKNGTAVEVKRGVPQTWADLAPCLSAEATGVCIPILNTEMLLAAVYISPERLWSDTDITERLGFRNKCMLAGDLSVKHLVWYSQVSNSSGLKLSELFVSSNFEISVHNALRITLLMVELTF
jgi:hypothetical protein